MSILIYLIVGLMVLESLLPAIKDSAAKQNRELEKDARKAERMQQNGIELKGDWIKIAEEQKDVEKSTGIIAILVIVAWPIFLAGSIKDSLGK